ncbi:MAG TPA: hypothetical protein VG604_00415 [Candidatus Saccharimonadales bacterium]|nr:hypothetical protein [Candidatus Saccharimonadales bacterium]
MPPRRYHFQSEWNFAAKPARIWGIITRQPFNWDEWWPQLESISDVKATPTLLGSAFTCSWRAPLGYHLACRLTITGVDLRKQAILKVDGDLSGTAICTLRPGTDGTHVHLDWHVTTNKSWMNWLAPILKPLFIWGHHSVMRSGERGFKKYLSKLADKK